MNVQTMKLWCPSVSIDISKWTKCMENKEFESRSQQKRAPKCVCVRVSADRFWYVIGRSPRVRNGNPLHGQRILVGFSPVGSQRVDTSEHAQWRTLNWTETSNLSFHAEFIYPKLPMNSKLSMSRFSHLMLFSLPSRKFLKECAIVIWDFHPSY